jgi:hypothetical protein
MTRHDTAFDPTDLEADDRIAPKLVASVPEQLGEPVAPSYPEQDETPPETQLVAMTETRRMDDVHSALLGDPETGVMVRASRHDSSAAWSQREADWTVSEVGTEIEVSDGEVSRAPDLDTIDDESEYVRDWVEVVADDHLAERWHMHDRMRLSGSTITMEDDYGPREGHATIDLVTD